jgi:DNA-binding helix-hairpin-helix protein with protein kinase domain
MVDTARKLKQCEKNPAHIWMADIPFCPYCNLSPDARIYYDQKNRDQEKAEREQKKSLKLCNTN